MKRYILVAAFSTLSLSGHIARSAVLSGNVDSHDEVCLAIERRLPETKRIRFDVDGLEGCLYLLPELDSEGLAACGVEVSTAVMTPNGRTVGPPRVVGWPRAQHSDRTALSMVSAVFCGDATIAERPALTGAVASALEGHASLYPLADTLRRAAMNKREALSRRVAALHLALSVGDDAGEWAISLLDDDVSPEVAWPIYAAASGSHVASRAALPRAIWLASNAPEQQTRIASTVFLAENAQLIPSNALALLLLLASQRCDVTLALKLKESSKLWSSVVVDTLPSLCPLGIADFRTFGILDEAAAIDTPTRSHGCR